MTDETKAVVEEMEDLELVTSYLNGQLDPERLEAVRRRLEEDAAFRDFAAPLLLLWSVPRLIERKPRPAGEWERDFSEFVRRTGFGQTPPAPPPKPRPRWRRWIAPLVILAYVLLATFQKPISEKRQYYDFPFTGNWSSLQDRIEVKLTPGSSLRVDYDKLRGMRHVVLEGSARFRVLPLHSASPALRENALLVDTRAGSVTAGESEFSVVARADTTVVFAFPIGPRRLVEPHLYTLFATIQRGDTMGSVGLRDLEGARLVRGRDPVHIPILRVP